MKCVLNLEVTEIKSFVNRGARLLFSAAHIVLKCVTVSQTCYPSLPGLSSQKTHHTLPLQSIFYLPQIQWTHLQENTIGFFLAGHLNETRQTDLFTGKWEKATVRSCMCLQAGPNTQNKEEWSSLWEFSVPFIAYPGQIYQSSFNVIYSHSVERM